MSWISWLLAAIGLFALISIALGLACFYFYAKALDEAHREGWDMPS